MDGEEQVDDGFSTRGGGPLASVTYLDDNLRGAAPFHHGVNVVGMARPRCSSLARRQGCMAQRADGGARQGHSPCVRVTYRAESSPRCSAAASDPMATPAWPQTRRRDAEAGEGPFSYGNGLIW